MNYIDNENYNKALDLINILSFILAIKNLDMNISQTDLQNETKRLDKIVNDKVDAALVDIHNHLQRQDQKIDYIISILEEIKEKLL